MDTADIYCQVNLPKYSMDRTIYSVQVLKDKIKFGVKRCTVKRAKAAFLYWNGNGITIQVYYVKKPKYNHETGLYTPHEKELLFEKSGSVEEIKQTLDELFNIY